MHLTVPLNLPAANIRSRNWIFFTIWRRHSDKNGDAVGSVLTYTKIIDQTGDADAYMLRGMAYQTVGDNTSAEKDLYQALEMNRKKL